MESYLIITSFALLSAGIIGLSNNNVPLGIISCMAGFVSIMYWAFPHRYVLIIDKTTSITTPVAYGIYAVVYVRGFFNVFLVWVLCLFSALFYHLSITLYENKRDNWIIFHALFHTTGFLGQTYVTIMF